MTLNSVGRALFTEVYALTRIRFATDAEWAAAAGIGRPQLSEIRARLRDIHVDRVARIAHRLHVGWATGVHAGVLRVRVWDER